MVHSIEALHLAQTAKTETHRWQDRAEHRAVWARRRHRRRIRGRRQIRQCGQRGRLHRRHCRIQHSESTPLIDRMFIMHCHWQASVICTRASETVHKSFKGSSAPEAPFQTPL